MNKQRKTSHILNVFQYDETTGAVTLPASLSLTTPDSADNSTKVATTAWIRTYIGSLSYATSASVTAAIANLVASAPTTLDTLNELATALGNDPNFATTITTALGNRLRIDTAAQGLTATQQGYGRTNLGLGTAATSNTGDFATAGHNHNGTYVPVGRTITINGTAYDLSADRAWSIASGVTAFNTRTGAITLTSGDVTGALGYTPYNSTNPSGYITGITSGMVTTALGYTPYNSSNPSGYVTSSGSVNYATTAGTASNISAYTINQSLGTGNSPSFVEGIFGTTGGATNQGIQIRYQNYTSGYGRIRFYQSDSNHMTIHAFSDSWQGGGFGTGNSAGAINIAGGAGVTFGGWNSCDAYIASGGAGWFRTSVTAQNYFYASGSIRLGDMWNSTGGLYRPSGIMCFGTENEGWRFSMANSQKAYIGTDGNLWMAWSGEYLSTTLDRKAVHRGEGTNYVDYSRYVYNNGAYSGSGWIEPSDLGVRYAASAGNAGFLPTAYAGGVQSNPQVYFNNGIGLKVAMTGSWSTWSDTLWVNGYAGGDVPWMCALHFLRNSEPRMSISAQTQGSGSYGSYYEVITDYNIASRRTNALKLWATSHPNDYYIVNNWTGSYWQLTTNHGSAVQVGYADNSGTASNLSGFDKTNPSFGAVYASNWFRAQGDCGLYSQDYGGHIRRALTGSYGNWETFGYNRNGWGGFVFLNNYNLNLMMNSSGDSGFYQENGNGWVLFYNRGNHCWGIGTDNTWSGDGLRCVKQVSAEYGYTTWSDRRAKENITSITGALDKVLSMNGVYFNYIKDDQKTKRVGFIAQELQLVLPEAVNYAEEIDEYNVNYGQIVSVIAEAMKEQDAKMKAQDAKIQRLEQLVEQLINQ